MFLPSPKNKSLDARIRWCERRFKHVISNHEHLSKQRVGISPLWSFDIIRSWTLLRQKSLLESIFQHVDMKRIQSFTSGRPLVKDMLMSRPSRPRTDKCGALEISCTSNDKWLATARVWILDCLWNVTRNLFLKWTWNLAHLHVRKRKRWY